MIFKFLEKNPSSLCQLGLCCHDKILIKPNLGGGMLFYLIIYIISEREAKAGD